MSLPPPPPHHLDSNPDDNQEEEECKHNDYNADDDDDDEDSLLDEMLQKAERLRLAMLAASSTKNIDDTSTPTTPEALNDKDNDCDDMEDDMDGDMEENNNIELGNSNHLMSSMPAIPETIETADDATDCSSMGYYSIVYGSTNPARTTSASKQWLREKQSYVKKNEIAEEEEKMNEDGSLHHALSDDGSSRRRPTGTIPPIATSWSVASTSNNEMLSPLAISPPHDDELVSVKDYLKTNKDQANGDDLIWLKVDFVDQADDDYVPLQDYSRTSSNDSTMVASSPETKFRRRKNQRKIVTFGLCCVVLGFLYLRLANNYTTNTPMLEASGTSIGFTFHETNNEVAVAAAPSKSIVADTTTKSNNSRSLIKRDTTVSAHKGGDVNSVAAIAIGTKFVHVNHSNKPKGGFFKAILTPGRVNDPMLWEHSAIDRRQILESFVVSMI